MTTRLIFYFGILVLTFFNFKTYGQKHEIGVAAGVMNYTGDLLSDYDITQARQSVYIFYRQNRSPAFSFKASILEGQFSANDKYSKDPLPEFRKSETGSTIIEFGLTGEYNFFNFRKDRERRRFTPYLTGGVGLFIFSQDSRIRQEVSDGTGISIPFGVGLKYQISRRVNTGIEFVARKTFRDDLDGIKSLKSFNGKELGDPHGKDWYYFTGFTLSFIFFTVDCPQSFKN